MSNKLDLVKKLKSLMNSSNEHERNSADGEI